MNEFGAMLNFSAIVSFRPAAAGSGIRPTITAQRPKSKAAFFIAIPLQLVIEVPLTRT